MRLTRLLAALVLLAVQGLAPLAGETLASIHNRGQLRCGVSEGIAGFSARDATGRWVGLEADFCRAVAAAVLGNGEQVEFVPLKASTRFPALQARRIDLLARNTTWTLTREALLQVTFPAVLFYDGQAFMVPRASGIEHLAELREGEVCVEKDTTHQQNLADLIRDQDLKLRLQEIDSASGAAQALFAGKCRALTSDSAQLAAVRLLAPGKPDDFVILPERISREPIGPVVAQGDEQWASVVRWVLHALVLAEAYDLTQANVEARVRKMRGPHGRLLRGEDLRLAKALDVQPDWAMRAVRAVGNYAELYERHLGSRSQLAIERGPNRLWRDGGLLYAPPID
ncbi:amino acid ABC transporter substrate-binding protein [Metapseudomonas resinovorans]|uniref:amino acid ABC transporter substrate-binding protein n=1 Tax=Metapseudomonas resinovorans TaxID=53412 RepID=UPI000411538A|nr:amino acid ABC transporter substrate-binding protein [Pseudomonas resinovorans]MDE3735680.1 amino acid ABC transporter substrate-binding protein [Pseudomonas resinovorans]